MKCIFSNCAAGKKSASLSASIGKCSAKASTQRRYWVKHHHGNTNPGRRNALHRRHRRPPGHAGPEPPRLRLQGRSEEHTSELQSRPHLVCRLLLEKKKKQTNIDIDDAKDRKSELRENTLQQ